MFFSKYQVGGSLKSDDPSYVIRAADRQLYTALKCGKFCSVFEARQMGKSSLLVRMKRNLEAEGFCCISLDMSSISGEQKQDESWYKCLLFQILIELDLIQTIQFHTWWEKYIALTPIQRFHQFIREIITIYLPHKKLLFLIDEVDSLLRLPFSLDNFFSLIRFYYDQRTIAPEYNRLIFAVFGVATPSDLVTDIVESPFSIGTSIELQGFKSTEIQPLIKGLEGKVSQPETVLKEILFWTGGQPFLTQKICQIVWKISQQNSNKILTIPQGKERLWIENIVQSYLIRSWEIQDEPEHLRTIKNRLIYNQKQTQTLLKIYQKILQGLNIEVDDSREQTELLLSGLVAKQEGLLKVKNNIYRHVFNLKWVEEQLTHSQDLELQSVLNKSSFSSS
ncbi:MAG: AAA-like domain-containing protein [Limnoraphis robusta]|uniref:AAA-like domain-containing protein n=1 Tax=Limnoraphis robusta TaxID=1118279 RepID=UPI00069CDEED|nr:AAA-like domain-containing protein [Limnoraphis robusta]